MYENIVCVGGVDDPSELNPQVLPRPSGLKEALYNQLDPKYHTVLFDQKEKLLNLYKSKTQDMVYIVAQYGSLPKPPDVNQLQWDTSYDGITFDELQQIAETIPISIVSPVWNAKEQYHNICKKHNYKPVIKEFHSYHNDLQIIQHFIYKNRNYQIDYDCNKLFICLNGRTTHIRALLLGKLSQYNLLKHAHCSWLDRNDKGKDMPRIHDFDPTVVKILETDSEIKEKLTKKTTHMEHIDSFQWKVGPAYTDSYIDVSVETYGQQEGINFTEKTWRPYWHGKPCIQLAPYGHYKMLRGWGFKMYHELFNYDELDQPSLRKRITGIANNLDRLSRMSKTQINDIIKSIEPTIIHNHNTVKTLDLGSIMPTPELQHLYDYHILILDQMMNQKDIFHNIGKKEPY